MKIKLTIIAFIFILSCKDSFGQTNLLRVWVGENHIDVVSTMTVDHGITTVKYSVPEGREYFSAEVNESWNGVRNAHIVNELPFETLAGGNTEQAKTWAQCMQTQIYNCNHYSFWCELYCLHGVQPHCVIKWGIQCINNPNARIETIE